MSRTVLIVDDHRAFRAAATVLLDGDGFEVVGDVADGKGALERGDQYALMVAHTDGQGAQPVLPFSSFRPRGISWGPAAK